MITKPISFVAICCNTDFLFGLTADGDVYYRDKPPWNYSNTNHNSHTNGVQNFVQQKKPDDEEKKVWKKLAMDARVEVPKGGHARNAQAANEPEQPQIQKDVIEIDIPAHKVYKDSDTVKAVQAALNEKGIYKHKIDGTLGKLTIEAIKVFQKSVQLKETGEIDFHLWNILNLDKFKSEAETVVEIDSEVAVKQES